MKKYFFTGFIALLPIALTLIIANWLFNLFTAPLAGLTEMFILSYEKQLGLEHGTPQYPRAVFKPRICADLTFAIDPPPRLLRAEIFDQCLLETPRTSLFPHPLVRTIFRLSNDITKAMFQENKKTFQETVLIPFPHNEALAIGFVTGDTP